MASIWDIASRIGIGGISVALDDPKCPDGVREVGGKNTKIAVFKAGMPVLADLANRLLV